jgi:hypothetical protein
MESSISLAYNTPSCDWSPSEHLLCRVSGLPSLPLLLFVTCHRMKNLHQCLCHINKELMCHKSHTGNPPLKHEFNYTCENISEQLLAEHRK